MVTLNIKTGLDPVLDINGLFCTDLQMFIPCAFYVLRIKKLKKNTQIVKILNSVNVMPK